MNEKEGRLLDCKAAAAYLGISEAALRKRIFLRQVDGLVRWGGRLYLDKEILDQYIDKLRIPIKQGSG